MNERPVAPRAQQTMQFADIMYVILRHKWKIGIISALAVIMSASYYLLAPAPGRSEAKLYIKYVMDNRDTVVGTDPNTRVRLPDQRGESIMSTEMDILSSVDLARDVAKSLGSDGKLKAFFGSDAESVAVSAIREGLKVEPTGKQSSVLRLTFSYRNSAATSQVLDRIISVYRERHKIAHGSDSDFDASLGREKKKMEDDLKSMERELMRAKTNANVIALEESKKQYAEKIARLQEQLLATKADLAERLAKNDRLKQFLVPAIAGSTNAPETNTVAEAAVPANVTSQYKRLTQDIERLQSKDDELALQYTEQFYLRKNLKEQLAEKEAEKSKLETQYPALFLTAAATERKVNSGTQGVLAQADPVSDEVAVAGLQARTNELSGQLAVLEVEANRLGEDELKIAELQRARDLQESAYRNIATALAQAEISKKLEPNRVVNIVDIQTPAPIVPDRSKIEKISWAILIGGLGLAFGLAFLLEFYVDRSVRSASDVESKLGIPVYISIPMLSNGEARPLSGNGSHALLAEKNGSHSENGKKPKVGVPAVRSAQTELASWDSRHALKPFYESLRDRLINFFELKNLTHKPKLVAVSSVSEGAGVSSVASGLAASLSETGEGNVLLVDMNLQNGAAHHFHKGDLTGGIDEALMADKREDTKVNENLYVVSERENVERLPGILPKRFKTLVPRLKASDYDYIIFDMPPVTQISITPRLARFMDMVFLVVESEKSDRDAVKRAGALLSEARTHVGVVLNKRREYMPKSLQQTF